MLLFCLLFFFTFSYAADQQLASQLKPSDRINLLIAKPDHLSDEVFRAQILAIIQSTEQETCEKIQSIQFVEGKRVGFSTTYSSTEIIRVKLKAMYQQDDEDLESFFIPSQTDTSRSTVSSGAGAAAAAASASSEREHSLLHDALEDETKRFLVSQGIEVAWVKDFYQKRKELISVRYKKIEQRYIAGLLLILSKSIPQTTDVQENELRFFQVFNCFYENIWIKANDALQQKLLKDKQSGKLESDFEIDSMTFFNAVFTTLQKDSIPLQTNENGSVEISQEAVISFTSNIIDNFTNLLEKQHNLVSTWKAKKTEDFLSACRISKEDFDSLTFSEQNLTIFIASILVDSPLGKKHSKEPWKDCKRLASKVLKFIEPLRQWVVVYKRHQGKTDQRSAEEIFNDSKNIILSELIKRLAQPELNSTRCVLDNERICWNEDLVKRLLDNITREAISLGQEGSNHGSSNHHLELVALTQKAQANSVQVAKVQEKKEQERQRAVLAAQKKAAQADLTKEHQKRIEQFLEEEKKIAAASRAIRDQRQTKKNELVAKIAAVKAQQEKEKQDHLKAISEEKKQKKQASQAYQAVMQQHEKSLQDIEIDDSQVQAKQALRNQREKEYHERSRLRETLDQSVNASKKSDGLNMNAQSWIPKARRSTARELPYSQRTSSCAILGPPPDLQVNTYGQLHSNDSCFCLYCLYPDFLIADFNPVINDAYPHSLHEYSALQEQQNINDFCSCPDCLHYCYPAADATYYAVSYNRQPPSYHETFGYK